MGARSAVVVAADLGGRPDDDGAVGTRPLLLRGCPCRPSDAAALERDPLPRDPLGRRPLLAAEHGEVSLVSRGEVSQHVPRDGGVTMMMVGGRQSRIGSPGDTG